MGAGAADYQAPRTHYGVPDLQGIWTSATITALERPEQFDTLVLSEAQAAAWERETSDRFDAIDELPEEGLQVGGDVGGYNSFWMDPGTRALRVRGEPRSSILVAPADGRLPMRLGARAKLGEFFLRVQGAFDGPEQRPLGERCIVGFGSTGGPPMLPVLYNNNYQIVQSPGHVMIHVEMNHDARIVRVGAEHLPDQVRPWLGDSVGRWEGDSLVVETTNFHPGQSFRAAIKHQFYMTPAAVVTERFTRIADDQILYQFDVVDPGAYTQPWSGELTLRRTDGPIYEYACHEGNYALPGILGGARVQENPPEEDEGI
ncbi:MAG: hypothetical protein GVY21_10015 [Gammaproteobacteria bacterium]|nr:hypothetical protein [Gammaproteobacteria bacterium]